MPEECIFCKIASGKLQAVKVFENSEFVAFLDIHPVVPGHTLVIPKEHFDRFESTPAQVAGQLFAVSQWVARGVARGVGTDSYNITVNNGTAAGQVIFHTHAHIIPRLAKDGLLAWPHRDYQGQQMDEIAKYIRAALKESGV